MMLLLTSYAKDVYMLTWQCQLGMRPAALVLLPTWMMPFRKVPVVITTLLQVICSPGPEKEPVSLTRQQ